MKSLFLNMSPFEKAAFVRMTVISTMSLVLSILAIGCSKPKQSPTAEQTTAARGNIDSDQKGKTNESPTIEQAVAARKTEVEAKKEALVAIMKEDAAIRKSERQEARDALREETAGQQNQEDQRVLSIRTMLRQYIPKQIKYYTEVKEESSARVKEIEEDGKRFSDALKKIEDKNNKLRRGPEYVVYEMLDSPELNGLAQKYLGKDFQSTRTAYTEQMRKIKELHVVEQTAIRDNQIQFETKVQGINEAQYEMNDKADRAISQANRNIDSKIKNLKARLASTSNAGLKRMLEEQLSQLELMQEQGGASRTHMDATKSESVTRAKYDMALDSKHSANEQVLARTSHEQGIMLLAETYRQDTINKLEDQMLSKKDIFKSKLEEAEGKLRYIDSKSATIDLMSYEDLQKYRHDLVSEVSDSFHDGNNK